MDKKRGRQRERERRESGYSSTASPSPSPMSPLMPSTPVGVVPRTPCSPACYAYSPMPPPSSYPSLHSNCTVYLESEGEEERATDLVEYSKKDTEKDQVSVNKNEPVKAVEAIEVNPPPPASPPVAVTVSEPVTETLTEHYDIPIPNWDFDAVSGEWALPPPEILFDIEEEINKDLLQYEETEERLDFRRHQEKEEALFQQEEGHSQQEVEVEQLQENPAAEPVQQVFMWDGLTVSFKDFKKAHGQYKEATDKAFDNPMLFSVKKAATILMDSLFTEQELKRQTVSGKKRGNGVDETSKLDPVKLVAIYRMVCRLKHLWKYNLELCIPDETFHQKELNEELDESEKMGVLFEVFCEHRNQLQQRQRRGYSRERVPDASPERREFVTHENIEWMDAHFICRKRLAEAFLAGDVYKSGMVLFKALFSQAELENGTLRKLGKRKITEKSELDPFRLEVVLEMVHHLQNKKRYPYSFPKITWSPQFKSSFPDDMRKEMRKKVFTQGRSHLASRGKPKKKRSSEPEPEPTPSTALASTSSPPTTTVFQLSPEQWNLMQFDQLVQSFFQAI